MDKYEEDFFYSDDGWPPEDYFYCKYPLPVIGEECGESDYDQFALVVNSVYPYLRLAKNRGSNRYPCGLSLSPSTDGFFAKKSDKERNNLCPKIAWGVAAVFLANLRYDSAQKDYVLQKPLMELFDRYYQSFLSSYLQCHSGLRYSGLTDEEKELNFIEEHTEKEKSLWDKSTPLKAYKVLYDYACKVVSDYTVYLNRRKIKIEQILMTRNNQFSTEIRIPFPDKPCVKVFFLDDSVAPQAKPVIEKLNSVRRVNISESHSSAHPGENLTVYPKPMVTAEFCEKDITEALQQLFSGKNIMRPVRTDAYFDNIETQVIRALDGARVSIHVAMAWFTNQKIADKLVEKFKEGLDVKVVCFDDHTNSKFGVDIDGIPYKAIRGTRGGTMHNKFCIIDNQVVLSGSYNWSVNAEKKNNENAAVWYDYERASDYSVEFRKLFESA